MRTIDQLFDRYGESHQHPFNKRVHWLCVPLITFSLLGMLWAVSPWLAIGLVILALGYYLGLSWVIATGMLVLVGLMLLVLSQLDQVFYISLLIFVLAWVGQFIGHKVEGKKPSFFEDIKFLLIGPAWLLGFVYRRWRIAY
ncbi:Mpo1 family 2-hydroxy fatty acid dioxygenase [Chitinimonas sp. BJB300]|uniref:Mpo1 family 2-hydroxy fatty acid dioxygenase n=1 Tax=Chitinimonas sp. BJB300 TaxID=1559339 RepID=UPI000C0C6D4F|nr:Mpo1-like protein [Chitinimonas sp. BJB300]PHV13062.1 hypothetical protein CSQ89_02505 [Chitinimonas sp. BJB300]TSJ87728.1 DUF962 domain-containing protein [Chitinimonas sp. BJB300]